MTKAVADLNHRLDLPSDQDSTGRSLGQEEMQLLREVIERGHLNSTRGTMVERLEKEFAASLDVKYAYACASGTAAIHTAIAAINPDPGDEIITSPITDMGAITPILYQGAIPVFAEVDPRSWNVTAESIEACLSARTRAIVVTHLFGNPCDMDPILDLAERREIPVIEDCAQAYCAEDRGRLAGTMGAIGCFSLQQGKHMTAGEGGLVVTRNDQLARRLFLFINKAWGYGDPQPDHYFLALNYRLTELQGAVAVAQLKKLRPMVEQRITAASQLTAHLKGVRGIEAPGVRPESVHTFWKYCLRVDDKVISGGAATLASRLKKMNISSAPRYIQKPAFMCELFQKQRTFGHSHYPFNLARPEVLHYDREHFPMTFEALEHILVLPWNERYTEEHVERLAQGIRTAVGESVGGVG